MGACLRVHVYEIKIKLNVVHYFWGTLFFYKIQKELGFYFMSLFICIYHSAPLFFPTASDS